MTKVVACIDGSNSTQAVCDYASWSSLKLEAPLEFLHVLDKKTNPQHSDISGNIGLGSRESLLKELTELDEKRGRIALQHGYERLESVKARAIQLGVTTPLSRQRHGDLVSTLQEIEQEVRLLVMGKQGADGDHFRDHVGSNIESVVRTMHRPILITPTMYKEPHNLMIAYDGSATTRKCVEMVAASPLFTGLTCHLVMVSNDAKETEKQLNWAKKVLTLAGFDVKCAVMVGDVKHALCAYRDQNDISMVVMGAYGHSKIRQFFVGSITTKMIQHTADVPLLLLR